MQIDRESSISTEEKDEKSIFKKILIGLLLLSFLIGIGYMVNGLLKADVTEKKVITKITLKDLPVPPPPPPPPPKEQPKEEPKEKPKEQLKEVKVEPKPVDTPPAEQLKMEGAAGDGPSPFAAGTVNEEYKGGEVKTIGSPSGASFNWYAGLIKSQIENALEKDKNLTEGQYKLIVSVWLKSNGEIDKLEWSGSDASPEIEQAIKIALQNMPAMKEPPPQDLPYPIKLRIAARKIG